MEQYMELSDLNHWLVTLRFIDIWLDYITKPYVRGHRGLDRMVVWFTNLCNQCLISRTVVGSNLIHDEVYSMQHYVKKFASDLQ